MSDIFVVWAVPALFCLLWMGFALANWSVLKNGGSMIAYIGGICGIIAILNAPIEGKIYWVWVPLLLDPGSLPYLFLMAYFLVRERGKK